MKSCSVFALITNQEATYIVEAMRVMYRPTRKALPNVIDPLKCLSRYDFTPKKMVLRAMTMVVYPIISPFSQSWFPSPRVNHIMAETMMPPMMP